MIPKPTEKVSAESDRVCLPPVRMHRNGRYDGKCAGQFGNILWVAAVFEITGGPLMATETNPQQTEATTDRRPTRPATSADNSRPRSSAVLLAAVATGVVAGVLIPPDGVRSVAERWLLNSSQQVADDAASDANAEHDDHGGTFEVSIAAQKTYGLVVGKASLGSFTQYIDVPAFIRERPTVSNLQASSRMQGIVRRIFVQVGQSVREGDHSCGTGTDRR